MAVVAIGAKHNKIAESGGLGGAQPLTHAAGCGERFGRAAASSPRPVLGVSDGPDPAVSYDILLLIFEKAPLNLISEKRSAVWEMVERWELDAGILGLNLATRPNPPGGRLLGR